MGPTRAWQEPPAKHGFATDRERLLWQHGHDVVAHVAADALAAPLRALAWELGIDEQVNAAAATLSNEQFVYAFLAGMSRAVGERDWRR